MTYTQKVYGIYLPMSLSYQLTPPYSPTLIGSCLATTAASPQPPSATKVAVSVSAAASCSTRALAMRVPSLASRTTKPAGSVEWGGEGVDGGWDYRGIPTKKGYNQTKHNKKYMFGGWMWFRTDFFQQLEVNLKYIIWLSFYIEWNNIGLFTHFHKEKGSYSHIYLYWPLLKSDFGD